MAFTRQRATRHRSHDSGLFRVRTESAIAENPEVVGEKVVSFSKPSSPVLKNYSRSSSSPIPRDYSRSAFRTESASMGPGSTQSAFMTFTVTSPVPSPVPQSFCQPNISFGNTLPAPVILSVSAPVSPNTDYSEKGQNCTVPILGNMCFSSDGNTISSAMPSMPCIPTPVKICRQVPVPQSFPSGPLQGSSSELRGMVTSPIRRLSHCRISSM